MKFVIQGKLPSLNDIINVARGNRYAGANQKKKETGRCALEIIRQTRERFSGPVSVSFLWVERDFRRDPDNITAGGKFVLDALVETGRIPNDTRKFIHKISHDFPAPEKDRPRVEVEIIEV